MPLPSTLCTASLDSNEHFYLLEDSDTKIITALLHFTGGINYHPTQQFGPPPHSPVSQAFAAAATSPGPDLSSYINSPASNSADGLGYNANSPQPSAFAHTMTVSPKFFSSIQISQNLQEFSLSSMPITFSFILHQCMKMLGN